MSRRRLAQYLEGLDERRGRPGDTDSAGKRRGRATARGELVQRFGSALNAHVHFCVIDGVFAVGEDEQMRFAEGGGADR